MHEGIRSLPRPTTPADLHRLADRAERNGIRVLVEPISGEHFATSATDPTKLYRLTGLSCTCRGFMGWHGLSHHALLLAKLGWSGVSAPTPPASPACGRGTASASRSGRRRTPSGSPPR